MITTAAMAGALLVSAATLAAQSGVPTPPEKQPAMQQQSSHTEKARELTQTALNEGQAGRTAQMVQNAEQALTHAKAAQKETPTPSLNEAVKNLQAAVDKAKAGKADSAVVAVQLALEKLTPVGRPPS
jgi:hypothetical protein